MKNFRVLASALAVIAFLGTSIQAIASDNAPKEEPTISIEQQDNQWFKLDIENLGNQAATISIKNSNEAVVYETKVNDAGSYGNLFKYRNLPKGSYTVTVDLNNVSYDLPLTVKHSGIEVNGSVQKNVKPTININNNVLSINVEEGTHKKVRILILDNNFDKIFSDKRKVNTAFTKSYDLKDLPAGEYMIKVKIEGKSYYKTVSM